MFKKNVFTSKHIVQLGQHIQKIQNLDAALSNTLILTFCLVYTEILEYCTGDNEGHRHYSKIIVLTNRVIKSSLFSKRNNLRIFQTEAKVY